MSIKILKSVAIYLIILVFIYPFAAEIKALKVKIEPISSELQLALKTSGAWRDSNPLNKKGGIKSLVLLTTPYYDFEGNIQEGKMIVLKLIAQKVANIFNQLFAQKFPVHKIDLAHNYEGGNNIILMNQNITSAFNHRLETGGTGGLSPHAWGISIDINPQQNPYISKDKTIYPSSGREFVERTNKRTGMIEGIVELFKKEGFEWIGDNAAAPDYHHFQFKIKKPTE